MKRSFKLLLAALVVYLALVFALLAAESGSAEASINSFGDALWYSLITMTTVGYGDLTPVTPFGRVLGLLFAICSVGILAALIAIGLRLISSELYPMLRLRLSRRQPWYVFAEASEEALALASALKRENPKALLLFPSAERDAPRDAVRIDRSCGSLSRLHQGGELAFFYMGTESLRNYTSALERARADLPSFCMTELPETRETPETLHFFDPSDALARSYWQTHPLRDSERCIVLIGTGRAAEALLERALLINVYPTGRPIEYHCFSFGESFAGLHHELVRSLGEGGDDGDSLVFHKGDWTEEEALLRRADRVILCAAEDEENLRIYEALKRCFVCHAAVDLRLSERVEGLPVFGVLDETLTPENVMRGELDRRAILMNEIYNRGASSSRSWRELSPFLRRSNIAAADHLPVKRQILLGGEYTSALTAEDCRLARQRFDSLDAASRERLRETEHRRWLRFHRMYNWRWAAKRNDEERLHPSVLPYGELDAKERAKDDYAWQLIGEVYESGREN